ncbi:MAG: hypothetical protein K2I53_15160, partial [Lachnospiraceae bacterium]|nr:hypothetical protein [Lachnospiraceae bacterium]
MSLVLTARMLPRNVELSSGNLYRKEVYHNHSYKSLRVCSGCEERLKREEVMPKRKAAKTESV